jgi:lysophospholipase L1-like esterase
MIGDLLHPHHAGYELWRDAVMPKFAEMLKIQQRHSGLTGE